MLSNIQYAFLGRLHLLLHLKVTLSTHTEIVFHVVKEVISKRKEVCRVKLCGLQDLSSQSTSLIIYGLRSAVCSP